MKFNLEFTPKISINNGGDSTGDDFSFSGEAGRYNVKIESHQLILEHGSLSESCGKTVDFHYRHDTFGPRIGHATFICNSDLILFDTKLDLARDSKTQNFLFPLAAQVQHLISNNEMLSVSMGLDLSEFIVDDGGWTIAQRGIITELSIVHTGAIKTAKIHRVNNENNNTNYCIADAINKITERLLNE